MPARKIIAVVEDNKDNRLLVRALLEDLYQITEYESAFQALAGFGASVPDLILLDISLPGMDGVEFLSRLRADERYKTIPVIALTAHAMSGDREQYLSAGFNDYVAKPIVNDLVLLKTIESRLAK